METKNLPKVLSFGRKVRIHRALVEKWLGRRLPKGIVVHHRNGDSSDNRLENLQMMRTKTHNQHHKPRKVRVCRVCGKDFYRQKNGARSNPTYCSRLCAGQEPTPRLCVGCGVVFFKQSKGRGRPPKFCTADCYQRWVKR